MSKTILLTGATDGIGLETAKRLVALGHKVLLHGRSSDKLEAVHKALSKDGDVESYIADLSDLAAVEAMANAVRAKHDKIDVLINNAGILKTPNIITKDGLDIRFMVNTIAPFYLTMQLLPLMEPQSRIINLSSAAQNPVNIEAMKTGEALPDMEVYSQSKLAITMWSREMALDHGADGPVVIPVNPGSLLASKMVKEGFGIAGNDIGIGADILVRASLEPEFASRSGEYFDNDKGDFGPPHPDALDRVKSGAVVAVIEAVIIKLGAS